MIRYKDYTIIVRFPRQVVVFRPGNVARKQVDAVVSTVREAKAWINRDVKG